MAKEPRSQNLVLQRLRQGPATAAELAAILYGESDEWTLDNISVVIYRLSKRGVGIELLKSGGRMQPGYYSLAHSATCPYCGGSGKLTTKDTVRR